MDLTILFGGLGDGVSAIGAALVAAFESVSTIFYTPGASPTLTLVGWLMIAALAVGFIKLALNLIVRLFTRVK